MKKGIFRKVGVAALSALTVTATAGLIPFAAPAAAQTTDGIDCARIFGGTRFETAIAIAEDTFGTTIPTVLIARGNGTEANPVGANPDSLSGAPLAGETGTGAPIILVEDDSIPASVADALDRWGTQNAIILGGTVAVSQGVEDELNANLAGTVTRVFGPTRYDTAADIASEVGPGTLAGETAVFLANGETFVDALAVSPEAYNAGLPILLTPPNELHDAAAGFIEENNVERVHILGGPVAIASQVEAEVVTLNGGTTQATRIQGGTAEDTAVEIAQQIAINELGWDLTHFNLANRAQDHLVDSLTGGPHGGEEEGVTLLASGTDTLGSATENFLEAAAAGTIDDDENNPVAGPTSCDILGGPEALSETVEQAAEAAATPDAPATNQDFTVSPAGEQRNDVSTDDTTNEGAESFTVTGVDAPVTIALVPCENVTDQDGVISFEDSDATANAADGLGTSSQGNAEIETVNGIAQPDATTRVDDVNPSNGAVTFTVDSTDFDCTYVVVFNDADGDGNLDLDANNQPTEDFAVAGPVQWLPAEAPSGTFAFGTVVFVDETDQDGRAGLFVLDDGFTYYYDCNDQFSYSGNTGTFFVTCAQFEDYLSVGDFIETTDVTGYSRDPAISNEFEIGNDELEAPTNLAVTVGDFDADAGDTAADDARFTWTASQEGLVDTYTVEVYEDDADAATACDAGVFEKSATTTGDETTVDVEELPDDTYCAVVFATSETGETSDNSDPVTFAVGAPADTTAPTITDALLDTDAGLQGVVDNGDIWELTFSEDMNATTATGGRFVLTDADGDTFTVDCGSAAAADDNITDATCALSDSEGATDTDGNTADLLTITIAEDAEDTNAGGDGVVEYPATITTTDADVKDEAGNVVNIAGSSDVIVDDETP